MGFVRIPCVIRARRYDYEHKVARICALRWSTHSVQPLCDAARADQYDQWRSLRWADQGDRCRQVAPVPTSIVYVASCATIADKWRDSASSQEGLFLFPFFVS